MLVVLVITYMNKLRCILQHRYLFKVLAIIVLFITLIITKNTKKESIYTNEKVFIGMVYKIKKTSDKTIIYINAKEKLIIYYYDALSKEIKLGDIIKVMGTLSLPENNTIPNNFKKNIYIIMIFITL